MILRALVDRYEARLREDEDGAVPRRYYMRKKANLCVNLSPDGQVLSLEKLATVVEVKGKPKEVPLSLLVPEPYVKTAGVKANFLYDNATYFFGACFSDKPQRALECFEASRALHLHVLRDAVGSVARTVRAFFESFDPKAEHPYLTRWEKELPSAALVFSAGGIFAQEDEECRRLWEKYRDETVGGISMRCLVTGETLPVAVLHNKISGVRGAQAIGGSIVSFNGPAFESYDREQGLNAPVSEYAAFAYTTAVNELLSSPKNRLFLGDMTVVYWAENADEEDVNLFGATMGNDAIENADALLDGMMKRVAQGKPVADARPNETFYILGLSPNAGRISVRFFYRDAFGAVMEHIAAHYRRLALDHAPFERDCLTPYWLLRGTVNLKLDDKKPSPPMAGAFLRAILTGSPYPESLHMAARDRIRGENAPSYERVSILKAYLIRNKGCKEADIVSLNPEWDDRAYLLGRLFSVLEEIQIKAYAERPNTTIKDKYFTSACATPAPIFALLFKLMPHHLRKLDSDMQRILNGKVGALMDMLPAGDSAIPTRLTLSEQDKFILGYYHQMRAGYRRKTDSAAADDAAPGNGEE